MYVVFVFELHPPHRFLLPFPTRRSSDLEADFADPDAPVRVVRAAREKLGPLDALVVNHARSGRGRLDELTATQLDAFLHENVRASLLLVKEFAAQFEADAGRVVFLTSGA